MNKGRYLFISDLQIPFEHAKALAFCKWLQKEFKIPPENVYNVGDEVDQYFGSLYKKDPDGYHTATSEIRISIEKLKAWYRAFPQMKIASSNHGQRWAKKAFDAEIPSQLLRAYQEVLQAPPGWVWKDRWLIRDDRPMTVIHGVGYGGTLAHRLAAIDYGTNLIMGHLHTNLGVVHIRTAALFLWAMATGCLIDEAAYAFGYGVNNRNKAALGAGIVIDGGRTALPIPMEAFG